MAEQTEEKKDDLEVSEALAMSDDDVASMTLEQFITSAPEKHNEEEADATGNVETAEASTDTLADTETNTTTNEDSTDDVNQEESEEETSEEETEEDVVPNGEDTVSDSADSDEGSTDESSTESSDTLTAEAQLKELFTPFRANGKDMQVETIEDARRLMQMGANYNKKMAGLKPNIKIIKMLENNGILDEDKLSYLIDLDKKKPEAVKKLIQESGVDPDTLDLGKEVDYKPSTYTVSDKEYEMDRVLEDIRDTSSFTDTIDIISTKWDSSSKQVLLDNPEIIKTINEHVATGIYAKIAEVVERDRTLGRLDGLSDIEAYKAVGDRLNAEGGFTKAPEQSRSLPKAAASTKTKPVDKKLRSRKKAASATKSAARSNVEDTFNPLSLSDEEFEKIAASKFM